MLRKLPPDQRLQLMIFLRQLRLFLTPYPVYFYWERKDKEPYAYAVRYAMGWIALLDILDARSKPGNVRYLEQIPRWEFKAIERIYSR